MFRRSPRFLTGAVSPVTVWLAHYFSRLQALFDRFFLLININPAYDVTNENSREFYMTMGSIFLSYAGTDREIAARVAEGLRGAGLAVWWDQGSNGVGWGDNWIDKLQETLSSCSAYVILIGSSGVRRWVKAELSIAIRRHFENNLPIFPMLLPGVSPEGLPPFLSIFQAQRLPQASDQIDFGALAVRLGETVSVDTGYNHPGIKRGVCPFPGLEAFSENEAPFFFGRQSETLNALRRLGPGLDGVYRRWLQIEGPSGVGKSSLVRAGLVPAIKRGWTEEDGRDGIRDWHVAGPMRPGANPVENLAEVLSKMNHIEFDPKTLGALYELLGEGPATAFRHLLRQGVPEGDGFVLVVDQFEEVFTLTTKVEDRTRFDELIAEALLDLNCPLHVISTIRTDSMLRFAELPRLHALLNQSADRYLLPPMTEAGLRDVVQTPARLAGLRWSDPSLPGEIVDEAVAEPGALPLIGNLLRLLWDERDGDVLDASIYRQQGGFGAALAGRADLLLDSLGPEGKKRARGLLLALVEPGRESQDSRRTITRAMALTAGGGGAPAEEVLDRLSGLRGQSTLRSAKAMPRLVVVSGNNESQAGETDVLVDLAHEALLRKDRRGKPYWKTLRDWVGAYRKQLENRHLLEIIAEKWQASGGSWRSAELARGRQLKDFLRVGAMVSDLGNEYLRASRRLNWFRSSAIGMLVFMVPIAATFGWWINELGVNLQAGARGLGVRIGLSGLAAPEMVELPSGTFLMGSPEGKGDNDEHPQHEVTIAAFAIGRYEVTFADWDTCIAAGGCSFRTADRGWDQGGRPVINVSWEDAQAYVSWLREVTGESYRLPSESEWEYAARASTVTEYAFGDEITEEQANFGENVGKTVKVGSYPANAWGLHDIHGNVWEWVEDCYSENYADAPTDGFAWLQDDCSQRVLRGGAWLNLPVDLRLADRGWGYPDSRNFYFGFRVARTLTP